MSQHSQEPTDLNFLSPDIKPDVCFDLKKLSLKKVFFPPNFACFLLKLLAIPIEPFFGEFKAYLRGFLFL